MENKGELLLNHDASIGAAVVGEKVHLRTKSNQTVKNSSP